MLAHILALAVGLVSFGLYMAAFFFPEVHRKSDFTWSGIGLFYALVLWVCAGRITGGVLLGQTASVALLGWLSWQTLNLRRELAPSNLRTPLPGNARTIAQVIQLKFGEVRSRWQQSTLAQRTNRAAGTAAGWIEGLTSSVAKPKRQPPPVGGRSMPSSELREPLIDAPDPAVAVAALPTRPARPARNLFAGLRSPKARIPQKPVAAPAPAPSLDDLEDWDDTPEAEVIPAVSEEITAMLEDEADAAVEAIEEVTVVLETDAPAGVEVIEVEVIEMAMPAEAESAAAESTSTVSEAAQAEISSESDSEDLSSN